MPPPVPLFVIVIVAVVSVAVALFVWFMDGKMRKIVGHITDMSPTAVPWWAWVLLIALATAPMIMNATEGVPTW